MERFNIEDWDNVVKAAEDKVWPTIEEEVGTEFFNNAMKYAGLEY